MLTHRKMSSRHDVIASLLRELANATLSFKCREQEKTEETDEPKGLTEYKLRTSVKVDGRLVGIGTVRKYLNLSQRLGWVETSRGTSRAKVAYILTDLGLFRAAKSNADLAPRISSWLGDKVPQFEKKRKQGQLRELHRWFKIVERVVQSDKAPPNWRATFELKADKNGHLLGIGSSMGVPVESRSRKV
jgi:hypothetical protein